MRHHLLALAAITTLAACGADSVGSDASYSTDSWDQPTQHGELDFAAPNAASFTSSARFHAWTFALTSEAQVDLRTELSAHNLDTVMYLYAADEQGNKVGAYLFKNDDAPGTMASQIAEPLAAGQYLVQVKAGKDLMTGSFSLMAGCAGAGCPVVEGPSLDDYCDGAEESFGKCMDDSLDATDEECAPAGVDAILCCNGSEQWYCEDLCDPADLGLVTVWDEDLEAVYQVFPETEYSGLMQYYSYAIATCAGPQLDDISRLVLEGDDLVEDPENLWVEDGWVMPADPDFYGYTMTEDVIRVVNELVGEEAAARWSASVEIPCPNCTDGFTKDVLYYPQIGKVILLESRWGGDS